MLREAPVAGIVLGSVLREAPVTGIVLGVCIVRGPCDRALCSGFILSEALVTEHCVRGLYCQRPM